MVGFAVAPIREPGAWQATQVVGVPLKMPPVWQLSHATARCWPFSSKPLVAWSKLLAVACANAGDSRRRAPASSASQADLGQIFRPVVTFAFFPLPANPRPQVATPPAARRS